MDRDGLRLEAGSGHRSSLNFLGDQVNKIIFMDIDGVLNNHDYNPRSQSSTIQVAPCERMSHVIETTGAKVVLISAWRYMIAGGACTTKGFEYWLRTSGMTAKIDIIGITESDEVCTACGHRNEKYLPACDSCKNQVLRAEQVLSWIAKNNFTGKYVVIDDGDFGFSERKMPFIQPAPQVGITDAEAAKAIEILMAE